MSIQAAGPQDGYESNLIVRTAIEALRAFGGGELSYGQAHRLLPMWRDARDLNEREREAILARFPRDCHDVSSDYVVIQDPGNSASGW